MREGKRKAPSLFYIIVVTLIIFAFVMIGLSMMNRWSSPGSKPLTKKVVKSPVKSPVKTPVSKTPARSSNAI